MLDDMLTPKETAALFKLSLWAVYQGVRQGKLPATRLWNGQIRLSRSALERMLEQG